MTHQQDIEILVHEDAKVDDVAISPIYFFIKRGLDLIGATLLILILWPVLLVAAIAVKIDSPGPVLFMQERVGRGKSLFKCLKFRSMYSNAEEVLRYWEMNNPEKFEEYRNSNFKLKEDPRVTKVGNFIRKFSIDELPQLFNVLAGDMSLVGPRPLLARELPDYKRSVDAYAAVRPGLTGLWQVSGRSGTTFDDRARLDGQYVMNMSLWGDVMILFKTVKVVLAKDGAY